MARVKIKSGESSFDIYDINDMYGDRIGIATARKILKIGTYTIRVTYVSGNGTELHRESKINVLEPQGDEAEAYNLFISTFRGMSSGMIKMDEGIRKLSTIEEAYPNSVYTPITLSILPAYYLYHLKDEQKANETYVRLVEKYPRASRFPGILNAALRSISDPVEKEKLINRIGEKTQDRFGKRFIQSVRDSKLYLNQAK
jgi:hypothetical protein